MSGNATYHVGHMNFGVLLDDFGSTTVAPLFEGADQVNAIAARSTGFVHNVHGETLSAQIAASDFPPASGPRFVATLSVWESAEHLLQFTENTLHGSFLNRREEWFESLTQPTYVIWPIRAGHIPKFEEAVERLRLLGENGPSSEAYDFKWFRKYADQTEKAHA